MLQTSGTAHKITEQFPDTHSAELLLRWARRRFGDQLAMSSSFGIQAAVTLHLATRIIPEINVVWVDTGYLPPETYEYATTLTRLLDLNIHRYKSSVSPSEMESQYGRLWESENTEDLDLYDKIRKVEPMKRALKELDVKGWISGLRSQQTDFRKGLATIRKKGDRFCIYPILNWTTRDTFYYMQQHGLPQHPLFYKGYATVGDAHSSRPMTAGDTDERDTRFRGRKQECGLHTMD